ncbi:hypothetical protein P8452_56979 [Trifolium repens]|nr:hypothetical protein P8452_56979 [Trifolium repens]
MKTFVQMHQKLLLVCDSITGCSAYEIEIMTAAAQLDKIMIAQKTILFYLMLGICMKQGLGNFMHQMLELWIHELGSIVISPRGYRAERLNGKNILMDIRGFSYPIAQWLTSPFECLQAIGFVSASRLISKSVCFWLWHEDFEIFHYRLPAVA